MVAQEVLHVQLSDFVKSKHVQKVQRLRVFGLIEEACALHLISVCWRRRALPLLDEIDRLLMLSGDSLFFLLQERFVHEKSEVFHFLVTAAEDVEAVLLAKSSLHYLLLLTLMLALEQL